MVHRATGRILLIMGMLIGASGLAIAPVSADPPANCREGRVLVSVVCSNGHWVPNTNRCPEGLVWAGYHCVSGKWDRYPEYCTMGQTAPGLECGGEVWVPASR